MTFQGLSYFLAVCEEGSVTKAAKKLFITQQTLSAHIQRLENACGAKLFHRKPFFVPTYAGERLAECARQMLRMKKEILAEIQDISEGSSGKMRLGFSGFLANEHLPCLLKQFYESHPQIEVITTTDASTPLETQALAGELDMYIGTYSGKNEELFVFPLLSIYLMVAVRASVLKRHCDFSEERIQRAFAEGFSLDDIKELPLIIPRKGWRVREPIDRYIEQHSLSLRVLIEANQQISLAASLEGLGGGIVYSATPYTCTGDSDPLYRFYLRDIDYAIQPCICYRKDHYQPKYEKDFIELTLKHFRSLQSHSAVQ